MSENDDPTVSDHELLAQYREMQRQGELSDEEFRLIKGQLAARMSLTPRRASETERTNRREYGNRSDKVRLRARQLRKGESRRAGVVPREQHKEES